LISALTLTAAMALAAAPAPSRAPITPAQIAAAITAAGMQVSADQVTMLTDVAAASASPALLVESMQPWGDRRMKVRLGCAASEQCLPFFVTVRLGQPSAAQSAIAASSTGILRAGTLGSGTDPKSFVVRAGAPATLLLDGDHVHIRIAVVCLENGAAGQTIRVASTDHRQTYMAKVIDQAVLRASL
jgi:hypothetical protein